MRRFRMAAVLAGVALVGTAASPIPPAIGPAALAPGSRVWLHAHNCYPDKGAWPDRLERALGTRLPWIAVEQDLAWAPGPVPGGGQPVVAHDTPLLGDEPTLEAHFFARVTPLLERALAEGQRDRWPVFVLHLEFKTNEPEHHQAVWALLGRYERFLTTAAKEPDGSPPSPLRVGPLLVIAESGEATFSARVPAGGTLRVFGMVPQREWSDEEKKQRHLFAADVLVPSGATSYRRFVNLPWDAVEADGPDAGGDWTPVDAARLRALVAREHAQGLWIRFYALNGHAPDAGQGWSASYNFGTLDAARVRWRAAIDAGVDFVATDQYEDFALEWQRALRR